MTSTAPWEAYLSRNQVHVQGAFENEHGERYIIYRNLKDGNAGDKLFIVGDELDWEPRLPLLPPPFAFSKDEGRKIAGILLAPSLILDDDGQVDPDVCLGYTYMAVLEKTLAEAVDEGLNFLVEYPLKRLGEALGSGRYDQIREASDAAREAVAEWFRTASGRRIGGPGPGRSRTTDGGPAGVDPRDAQP